MTKMHSAGWAARDRQGGHGATTRSVVALIRMALLDVSPRGLALVLWPARQVANRGRRARFFIAGSGNSHRYLEALASRRRQASTKTSAPVTISTSAVFSVQ
jgi:hypothetical protein